MYTDFSKYFLEDKTEQQMDIMCLNLNRVYSHDKVSLFFSIFIHL